MDSAAVKLDRAGGLEAAREVGDAVRDLARFADEALLRRWLEHPACAILHHEAACCDRARLWFLAFARSMEIGALSQYALRAPVWLSQQFKWGPSEWPIAWCQVVKRKTVDCGVFAALAREVFVAQGHSAHPAQAILAYNRDCTRHWKELWKITEEDVDAEKTFPWIGEELVYHEICALEMPDGEARLYDSTWGTWLHPSRRHGHGALLAVRTECPRLLRWGGRELSCGEWVSV